MGFIRHLSERISVMPQGENRQPNKLYFHIYEQSISGDYAAKDENQNDIVKSVNFTPNPDWNQIDPHKSSYILNKPELGTIVSYDAIGDNEEIGLNKKIPTNDKVYALFNAAMSRAESTISLLHGPYPVEGIADMVDTTKCYVYMGRKTTQTNQETGEEETVTVIEDNMAKLHVYYYNGTDWVDAGPCTTNTIETDKHLIRSNMPADGFVVGSKINELVSAINDIDERVNKVESDIENIKFESLSFINSLDVTDDGLIYIMHDDIRVNGPYGPFAGNGSSGSGGGSGETINAHMTARNTSGWISKPIPYLGNLVITGYWESIEEDLPTGDGSLTVTIGNRVVISKTIPQGEIEITLDVKKDFTSTGVNSITWTVSDIYGQKKRFTQSVNIIELSIASTLDVTVPFDGPIFVPYTPYGAIEKDIYFEVDGVVQQELTRTTAITNRQMSTTIPTQSYGAHTLKIYMQATLGGELVKSNELFYEIVCVDSSSDAPVITSSFNKTSVNQHDTVNIPYRVYSPASTEVAVQIYVNNVLATTQTVDRSEQVFTYKASNSGEVTVRFETSGSLTKTIEFTVVASDIHVEAETEALVLNLSPMGRTNNESAQERSTWEFDQISAQFTNFKWRRDGWQKDNDNITVLRHEAYARTFIPLYPFAEDIKQTGLTIELDFATHSVIDPAAEIITCFADGIGFKVTAQNILFKGAQSELMTLFKDGERIRLSITVEKQMDNRLILLYENGIMSAAKQYAPGERFSQTTPAGISIGSNLCGVDIYHVRVYQNNLNRVQIKDNWVADTEDGELMIARYNRNDVYDAYGNITPETIRDKIAYIIYEVDQMPQYKGDKRIAHIDFSDPDDSLYSYTADGVQINVQGTSSAIYYRKNIDLQHKKGFDLSTGHSANYKIFATSFPFNRFVTKADVASSEGANNTVGAMIYNDLCPYKFPEMLADSRVRWGIEGRPILSFWRDPSDNHVEFLGKANFNLPKRAPGPYGYEGDDQSWEVERNNSENVKFQGVDFATLKWNNETQEWYPEWYDDFEARFPDDTFRDTSVLGEAMELIVSTNRNKCTNELLAEPVTYTLTDISTLSAYSDDESYTVVTNGNQREVTFTKDTPAYRLTKFKVEAPNYIEMESAEFYYLFFHFMLGIDSYAKNMFVGFHGSIAVGYNYITRKITLEPYDLDTLMGTNNSGVLMFGYHLIDTDRVDSVVSGSGSSGSNAPVFNAQDSTIHNNIRDAFRPDIANMYKNLRSSGKFSYEVIANRFSAHQEKWSEAMFNEDGQTKYIVPLVEAVTIDEETGQPIKTDRYLTMLQGCKDPQRRWWLWGRFRFFDSMYNTGSSQANVVSMRVFNSGTIEAKYATYLFASLAFGGGTTPIQVRVEPGETARFTYQSVSGVNEMETWMFDGDLLIWVNDFAPLYINEADFSKATRIRRLKFGDTDQNYSNPNMRTFDIRNCYMLTYLNSANCPNLNINVFAENSPFLEEVYLEGTAVTGFDPAEGGSLRVLHLPGTIRTFTGIDLVDLEELEVESYENITRMMIANLPADVFDIMEVLEEVPDDALLYIGGFEFEATNTADIEDLYDEFDRFKGVTRDKGSNGEWVYHEYNTAQISGNIHTNSIKGNAAADFRARYPYIRIEADHMEATIYYHNDDGTLWDTETILDGGDGTKVNDRTRPSTAQYDYTPDGWTTMQGGIKNATILQHVTLDLHVYPAFTSTVRTYTVTWKNANGTVLETDQNVPYGSTPTYNSATPTQDGYNSIGWAPDVGPITGDTIYTASYLPLYTATFKTGSDDGNQTYQSGRWQKDTVPVYSGNTPTTTKGNDIDFTFIGWNPALSAITADTTYTAVFRDNRSVTVKYLTGQLVDYESNSNTKFATDGFYNMTSLVTAKAPATTVESYAFRGCSNLETVDLSSASSVSIAQNAFNGNSKLTHLVIRSNSMITFINATMFTSTKIANMKGAIYVPNALVATYKADTNWKNYIITSVDNYPLSESDLNQVQIDALSTISDSWAEIIENADYATDYQIGDTKAFVVSGYGVVAMELVAFDTDNRADEDTTKNNGKARMTWIAKDLLTTHNMNSSSTNSGGWESSNMRTWLRGTILPLFPEEIQNNIVEVKKVQSLYSGSLVKDGQTTSDTIWIPSDHEVGFGTDYETTGPVYSVKFTNNASRVKKLNGSASYWWLRSCNGYSYYFRCVYSDGSASYSSADVSNGVAPGFCL